METLPILEDLTNEQFEKLLTICEKKSFPPDFVIYKEGGRSLDMYILTEGALLVTLWGKEIGRIFPISVVGEIGLFTGEPRTATVTTLTNCSLLRITKDDLFKLFEEDKDLHIRFQNGMIRDMADKLKQTNEVIAKLKSKVEKKL